MLFVPLEEPKYLELGWIYVDVFGRLVLTFVGLVLEIGLVKTNKSNSALEFAKTLALRFGVGLRLR